MSPEYQNKIGNIIRSFLQSFPSRETIKDFVNLCQKIISSYLYKKENYKNYFYSIFGLTIEDLSFDCMADMFKINQEGYYQEFVHYFMHISSEKEPTDLDLLIYLRRLLFSKTNNHLFRLNREYDPTLGRIIRNIKLAAQTNSNIITSTFFDQNILTIKSYDWSLDYKTIIPMEILEINLSKEAINNPNIKKFISKLEEFLEKLDEYKKCVYMLDVALILRNSMIRGLTPSKDFLIDDKIHEADVSELINKVTTEVRKDLLSNYVSKNKLSNELSEIYFITMKTILLDHYINNGNGRSYMEYLVMQIPELTMEEYLKTHRTKIEYIVKYAKGMANEILKKEFYNL